jgi:hypothetical protein
MRRRSSRTPSCATATTTSWPGSSERLHDEKGVPVKLVYSDALRDEAELEAAVHGKSLADYEKQLEDEMAAVQPDAASATVQ